MKNKEKFTIIDVDVEPFKKKKKLDVDVEDADSASKSLGETMLDRFKKLIGAEKAVKVPTEYQPTDVPTFYDQLAEKLPEPAPGKPNQVDETVDLDAAQRRLDRIKGSELEKDKKKREELEALLRQHKRLK